MLTKRHSQTVFAFLGSDLGKNADHLFRYVTGQKWTILALDSEGIAAASAAGVEYTLLDDWVKTNAFIRAKNDARAWESAWYDQEVDFEIDEINWATFDREAMYNFWLSHAVSYEMHAILRLSGVEKLACAISGAINPSLYYYPTNTHIAFWNELWRDNLIKLDASQLGQPKLPIIKRNSGRIISSIWRRIRNVVSKKSFILDARLHAAFIPVPKPSSNCLHFSNHAAQLCDAIVVSLNPGELHRMLPQIRALELGACGHIVVVIYGGTNEQAEELACEINLPVFFTGTGEILPEVADQFSKSYHALLTNDNEPWLRVLSSQPIHFEYYCRQRWPRLHDLFCKWSAVLKVGRPKALFVSTLEDAESQLPAEAANRLGIPTLTLSHGAGLTRITQERAMTVLHGLEIDREVYVRSGIPTERLVGCVDCFPADEYLSVRVKPFTKTDARKILVLTASTSRPGIIYPAIAPRCQIQALRALAQNPSDLSFSIEILIKPHPALPDLEIIKAAGSAIESMQVSPNVSLTDLIKACDLVIALNYIGIATVHACLHEKPVIFFWTDGAIGCAEPYSFGDLFSEAGILVRTSDELWDSIRAYFTDPVFKEVLRQKRLEYSRKFLSQSGYVRLFDPLSLILSPAASAN